MPKIVIEFEVDEEESFAGGLHEALCKTIHEGDEEAMAWLQEHVENISTSEQGD